MTERKTRKPLRLPQFDYSQNGAYFLTVCTEKRRNILGTVVGGGVLDAPRIELSSYGTIVENTLLSIETMYHDVSVDKYVIMPNHIHMIVVLSSDGGSSRTPTPTNMRIPALISTLKRFSNRTCGTALWQRSYYDHVIRSEADYLQIWEYIQNNPAHWAEDEYYYEVTT